MLGDRFKYFLLLLLTILKSNSVHASDDISDNIPEIAEDGDSLPPGELRIVHGILGDNKYPFVVQVVNQDVNHFCGGTLIAKKYVLTAASCCSPEHISEYAILYNTNILGDAKVWPITRVTTMIIHPKYEAATPRKNPKNDLCILRLSSPAPSINYYPALDSDLDLYTGRFTVAFGHGMASVHDFDQSEITLSSQLRWVRLPIISPEECAEEFWEDSIHDRVICAGYRRDQTSPHEGNPSICQGDFGGPLFIEEGMNTFTQIGISSFSYGCGVSYGVFTRVAVYRFWILAVIDECDTYFKENQGATSCYVTRGTTVSLMSTTVSALSASLILMIAALVPFTLF